jgi:hypothetical protein
MTAMMRENEPTSYARSTLDWTPARAESGVASHSARTDGRTGCWSDSRQLAGSPSVPKLECALISLQNRSRVRFGTLSLVWHLILLTIAGVAYGLHNEVNADGF